MGLFTSFQLKSRDAGTRRRAALKLGVAGRTSGIAALEPLLEDPDWEVREAAAQALGTIGDGGGTRPLIAAIRNADGLANQEAASAVRRACVEGLARIKTPAVPALLDALHDRHAKLREAAIDALGAIGGADSVKALTIALGDDRSNVRQAAAPALARAAGREAVATLRAALSHKDPATRRSAAAALGTIADATAAQALRAALADRDRPVREVAVQSLVTLATPGAVGALCASLLDGDRELKALAAEALRSFTWSPADASQRLVLAVLQGRFADAAAEGEAAVAPLLAALADREAATRRGAAEALGGFRDRRVSSALASSLADPDAGVRDAAVSALARIGPDAAGPLVRALDDRGGTARAAAARAIAAVGERVLAAEVMSPLRAGQAMTHAGEPLRVVGDREALDEARVAADLLTILVSQAARQLPVEPLRTVAALEDVMLIEPGRVPDPDERVSCEALRKAAQRELKARDAT